MAMVLPMVPVGTKSAAGLPAISAARSSRRLTVGSSRYTSSPTSASNMACRMARVGAESHVGIELPVFQIVPRFVARTGEIRDFVARDSDRGEPIDGQFVEPCGGVLRRRVHGAVAHAAEQQFFTEAAVLIDLQHVDRDVLGRDPLDPIQRFAP